MKRFYPLFVTLVAFSSWLNVAAANIVQMPDANLTAVVRETLDLGSNEAITQQALQGLTNLNAQWKQITDLTGLEHATNLTWLYLWDNQINDLTPIKNLKTLHTLEVCNNPLSDITPIAGLTNLVDLSIGCGGYISDIRPLENLKNLTDLFIGAGVVSDITPLENLENLESLIICPNLISDITPLENLENLQYLGVYDNPLRNITPLENLENLQSLDIHENLISDITPLENLTDLTSLNLSHNQIRDVSPIVGLTHLTTLQALGNPIENLSSLSELSNLENLDILLTGHGVEWIADDALEAVVRGILIHHRFGRFGTGSQLTLTKQTMLELTNMEAHNLQITDLTGIEHATQLQELSLNDNQISDISPLADLVNLQYLDLRRNSISDVSQLADLADLKLVLLQGNSTLDTDSLHTLRTENPDMAIITDQHLPSVLVDAAELPPIYWIDSGRPVGKSANRFHRLTGTGVEILTPSIQNTTGLVVDAAGRKLYWMEKTNDTTGKIWRTNLDGSNAELVKELTSVPLGIAIDTGNSILYLTNSWGKVQRMNLDGTNFQPNLVTGLDSPTDIVVDTVGSKIYWIEKTSNSASKIQRANLNGANVELVKELTSVPYHIAIDATNSKLYLVNPWGEIQRMNLDGTNFQSDFITGLRSPQEIAVDTTDGKLYWTEFQGIWRADLNGENIQQVIGDVKIPTVFALEMSTNTNPAAPTNISSAAPQTATPTETQLLANYPNPFNPETWIPYQLAKDTDVQLLIYDMHGKIVRSLTLEHQFAGYYTNSSRAAYWDGRNALGERVASGVYFYQLLTTETSLIRKMVILK